jgi:hypothetical protein
LLSIAGVEIVVLPLVAYNNETAALFPEMPLPVAVFNWS